MEYWIVGCNRFFEAVSVDLDYYTNSFLHEASVQELGHVLSNPASRWRDVEASSLRDICHFRADPSNDIFMDDLGSLLISAGIGDELLNVSDSLSDLRVFQ